MEPIPFRYVRHLVAVPVHLGEVETELIFDSGIGINLISGDLASALGCEPTGLVFTGRRMSGQELEVPLAKLSSLALGERRWKDVDVAILDMAGPAGIEGVTGFLSLSLFDRTAVTVDFPSESIIVEEPDSLAQRAAAGTSVPVEVERDGPSAVVYSRISLPCGGEPIRVEVDLGTDRLILDTGFAGRLGIELEDDAVEKVRGGDETGHDFIRYFTKLLGEVSLTAAEDISQQDPDVMFQRIIHEGLVGVSFLRRFAVTFDLPSERMILGPPSL